MTDTAGDLKKFKIIVSSYKRSKPMEHKKDHSACKNDPFLFYRAGVQRVQPFDGLLRQSLNARCRSKTPTGLQGQSHCSDPR